MVRRNQYRMAGSTVRWTLILTFWLSTWSALSPTSFGKMQSKREGCIWWRKPNEKAMSVNGAKGEFMLDCHLLSLTVDFWSSHSFSGQQHTFTQALRVKCNEEQLSQSFLPQKNDTLAHLSSLKEISIEGCKIRRMDEGIWSSLSNLQVLRIHTKNIDWGGSITLEFSPGAFQGLVKLSELDLSDNNIWDLGDKNLLCPLSQMKQLNLSHNAIVEFHQLTPNPQTACDLSNLVVVDLSHNKIRHLEGQAFARGGRRISHIHLENNLIEELHDSAFKLMTNLKMLNLSSNRLVALPPNILSDGKALIELYVKDNKLSTLSPTLFESLEKLKVLELSGNNLKSLKGSIFSKCVDLTILNLNSNDIEDLDDPTIFEGISGLKVLSVNNNRISKIHPSGLKNLGNLEILDVSRNMLVTLAPGVLGYNGKLKQLYLDHNELEKLEPQIFVNTSNSLRDLGLGSNGLKNIPEAIQSLTQLVTLDLGENSIDSVEEEKMKYFKKLSNLYGLRLVGNHLTSIPSGFCNYLRKLRILNVAANKIMSLEPSSFSGCDEVRALRIDGNKLSELSATLGAELPSLLWLNVSRNNLKSFHYNGALPRSVEWLDLSHNELTSLRNAGDPYITNDGGQGIGGGLPTKKRVPWNLRVIDVSHNELSRLDSTYFPSSIQRIRVNHNELISIAPNTFWRYSALRTVELIGNQLKRLSLSSLRVSNPSAEFQIRNNPFQCDCEMEWLKTNYTGRGGPGRGNYAASPRYGNVIDLYAVMCPLQEESQNSLRKHVRGSESFKNLTSEQDWVGENNSSGNNDTDVASGGENHATERSMMIPFLEKQDWLCYYKSHCPMHCYCCDFDACDCEMSCPQGCRCSHDYAWSQNIIDCSNSNFTNELPERMPMDATEIHLDGNFLWNVESHGFIGKKNLATLFLNHSNIHEIQNKSFNGLQNLQNLYLHNNELSVLTGYEFIDTPNLLQLFLNDNKLRVIAPATFSTLRYLQVLRLHGNQLKSFTLWELSNSNIHLSLISLRENPWSCDCGFVLHAKSWFRSVAIVEQPESFQCFSEASSSLLKLTEVPCVQEKLGEFSDANLDGSDTIISRSNHVPSNSLTTASSGIRGESGGGSASGSNFVSSGTLPGSANAIFQNSSATTSGDKPATTTVPFTVHKASESQESFWTLISILVTLVVLLIVILLIFRKEVCHSSCWSKSSKSLMNCGGKINFVCSQGDCMDDQGSCEDSNSEKLFDAYFIYGRTEGDFIVDKISQNLNEHQSIGGSYYRFCFHHKDLNTSLITPPSLLMHCGDENGPVQWTNVDSELMTSACQSSKRLVILLTTTFLPVLCRPQNIQAISQGFNLCNSNSQGSSGGSNNPKKNSSSNKKRLIFILFPPFNVNNVTQVIPQELLINDPAIFIEWQDESIWSKLKSWLPSPSGTHSALNTLSSLHFRNRKFGSASSSDPLYDANSGSVHSMYNYRPQAMYQNSGAATTPNTPFHSHTLNFRIHPQHVSSVNTIERIDRLSRQVTLTAGGNPGLFPKPHGLLPPLPPLGPFSTAVTSSGGGGTVTVSTTTSTPISSSVSKLSNGRSLRANSPRAPVPLPPSSDEEHVYSTLDLDSYPSNHSQFSGSVATRSPTSSGFNQDVKTAPMYFV